MSYSTAILEEIRTAIMMQERRLVRFEKPRVSWSTLQELQYHMRAREELNRGIEKEREEMRSRGQLGLVRFHRTYFHQIESFTHGHANGY